MTLLVGIDEAGYGPKLGPLVMTAAMLRCDAPFPDLWDALDRAVTRTRDRSGRLFVGDSKLAFDGTAGGLARLEKTALAFLAAARGRVADADTLMHGLGAPAAVSDHDTYPWYVGFNTPLPVHADPATVDERTADLSDALAEARMSFAGFSCQVHRAREFNAEIRRTGNKAHVLFAACARLIQWALDTDDDLDVTIEVDRHGGRWYYADLLANAFPMARIEPRLETPVRSEYFMNVLDRRVHIAFTVHADLASFPVALASMVSKYVRELHMRAFNAWWQARVPGLAATAGYAAHAAEFIRQIEPTIQDAGIDRLALVRLR